MTAQLDVSWEQNPSELSVPVMMDMLDNIHRDAQREECLEEFADAIDRAMCVLAELQRQAFEVMQEVETEKHMYGSRYTALAHKVC